MRRIAWIATCLLALGVSQPQYPQPDWNWEAVILSRNGPSTTTTPRPTRWTTTTLRSIDGAKIVGVGRASVEEEILVPRRSRPKPFWEGESSGSMSVISKANPWIMCLIVWVARLVRIS